LVQITSLSSKDKNKHTINTERVFIGPLYFKNLNYIKWKN